MADFKLGVTGSEYNLPTCVTEELGGERDDACDLIEMQDGSLQANFRTSVPKTHEINFDGMTLAEYQVLETIHGLGQVLNYINGYKGITGEAVVVQNLSEPSLIVETSGDATPLFRATLILRKL